jgi:hypothetical protein
MFAVLHSDIISLKSGLLHLTGQPYCKKGRSANLKDGIINLILRNYLINGYRSGVQLLLDFAVLPNVKLKFAVLPNDKLKFCCVAKC